MRTGDVIRIAVLSFVLAFLLSIGRILTTWAAPQMPSGTQVATLGYISPSITSLPYLFGVEKGFYRAEGLEVRLVMMKAATSVNGLVTGDLDYTSASIAAIRAAIRGLPVKNFMFTVSESPWFLVVSPEINSVKDLKDKTIGFAGRGGATEILGKRVLEYYRLLPDKDVKRLDLVTQGNVYAAMKAGKIQGAVFDPPWSSMAKKDGFKSILWTGDVASMAVGGLATTDKNLVDNPEQVRKVIKATLKTLRYLTDDKNREEILQYIRRALNADKEVAEDTYTTAHKTLSRDGTATDKAMEAKFEFAKGDSGVEGHVPMSRGIDLTILGEVQKELKLR